MNKLFIARNFPSHLRRGAIMLIMAGWFLTSCLTIGKIQRNCDKFARVCITDSKTTVVYRDTTIFITDTLVVDKIIEVPVPQYKDSVNIRDSVRIVNQYAFFKPVHKENGIIAVDASINYSVLKIDSYLTDSTILYHYQDKLTYEDSVKIAGAIKEKTTDNTVVLPPERYVPKIYKITFWLVILAVVAIGVYFRSRIISGFGVVKKVFSNLK